MKATLYQPSLARCNESHLKQSLSDQGPAGVIGVLAVCAPCALVDQEVFVFLDLSLDRRSGWTGSAVVLLSNV